MTIFIGIVARDKNHCIGEKGSNFIPFSLPTDMKHFKNITDNKVLLVGNNTFKSIQQKHNKINPFKNKELVYILTRGKPYEYENLRFINSITEINNELVYVIGGSSIYSMLDHQIKKVYITEIDTDFNCNNPVYCDWNIHTELHKKTFYENNINFSIIEGIKK